LNTNIVKLGKINRGHLLNQKIYKILKAQILEGNLEPGSKLVGEKLAEQMGVSRTPIREAIKWLAVEGFVNTIPGHGTFVNSVSIKDLKEVLQVRGVLEGLAAKLAIEVIKDEQIEELERIIKEMEYYAKEKNLPAFSDCSQRLQELIIDISGNTQLKKIRKIINDQTHRYRIRSLSSPRRLEHSFKEHRDIFEAIKNRDPEKADKLSKIHTENVFQNIVAHAKTKGDEEQLV
jgi:DNA-binding GntR family transcriptional regulator